MNWIRYDFYTNSVDDCRPLIFNPQYPWWCAGYAGTLDGMDQAIIVAWLPESEDLYKYWDDASRIENEVHDKIIFNSRFPKPKWFTGIDYEVE